MNDASGWRLLLAREIPPAYVADARVQAVLVLGSVSRGWADRYSDVEFGIVWAAAPSEDQRASACDRAGGSSRKAPPYNAEIEAWEEEYRVRGVKIDVVVHQGRIDG